MTRKTRILLADDHRLLRMGLAALIAIERDMEVVGEAETGLATIEAARSLRPDVIIMDLMMPEMSGAEATRAVHAELPDIKILVLTSFGTSAEMAEAINGGAVGALIKDTATDDLIAAIRTVRDGKRVIPKKLLSFAKDFAETPKLSAHQLEILESVTKGLSNADIARLHNLSEITIKKQLSTIFERIGAANRSEAIAIAFRRQLLKI